MSGIRNLVYQLRSPSVTIRRLASTKGTVAQAANQAAKDTEPQQDNTTTSVHDQNDPKTSKKTQAQLDEEMQQKLAAIAGDGGEAGVEYEDGQPVAMKRSVKSNMFRYI